MQFSLSSGITLAALACSAVTKADTPPFGIIVTSSAASSTSPSFLTKTGSIGPRSSAATCSVNTAGMLFCGDFFDAVGIPTSSSSSVLTSCFGSCLTKTVSLVGQGNQTLAWTGVDFWFSPANTTVFASLSSAVPPTTDAVTAVLNVSFNGS